MFTSIHHGRPVLGAELIRNRMGLVPAPIELTEQRRGWAARQSQRGDVYKRETQCGKGRPPRVLLTMCNLGSLDGFISCLPSPVPCLGPAETSASLQERQGQGSRADRCGTAGRAPLCVGHLHAGGRHLSYRPPGDGSPRGEGELREVQVALSPCRRCQQGS